jgi:hypothetical protein
MQRLNTVFLSGMILFLLVSCDVFMSNYGQDKGNLVVHFPGAAGAAGYNSVARSAVPGAGTQALLEYRITAANGSQTASAVVPAGQTSTVLSVAPGVWDIQAEAYLPPGPYAGNHLPVHVGTGTAQAEVKAGQANSVSIKMIFDNTTPASVEVVYMGTTYTAALGGNGIYEVVLPNYDTTQSVAITVNPAVPDQDISAVTNNNLPTSSYVNSRGQNSLEYGSNSPVFTVSAGDGYAAEYTVKLVFPLYTLVDTSTAEMDLKARFGISASGTQGVTEAFNALHYLISAPNEGDNFTTDIHLGDWIDLDSLTVARYHTGTEAPDNTNDIDTDTNRENGAIDTANMDVTNGKLLRLIVVGIDSFNGKNGNTTPHVVFQFQNLPGYHRMNPTATTVGGYAASEMRTYLTDYFYPGLTAAGVPDAVVWTPSRRVWNGFTQAERDANTHSSANTTVDTITDKLWLPTVWEMFGSNSSVLVYENAGNQTWLEYYTDNTSRIKYNSSNVAALYWEASPYSQSGGGQVFVSCGSGGHNDIGFSANAGFGCAPAFCVK